LFIPVSVERAPLGVRQHHPPAAAQARPGDKWHMDEVVFKISGKTHYLWRAVDQHGIVLDILVQSRRNKKSRRVYRMSLDSLVIYSLASESKVSKAGVI
jgi:transposase-like protein